MSAAAAGASALGLMPPEYQRVLERVKAEQTGLTKLIGMQQQFETQLNENAMVKEVGGPALSLSFEQLHVQKAHRAGD